MFAVARPLLAKVKLSTGIPGLKVVPNAREVLIDLYTQMLRDVKAVQQHSDEDEYRSSAEAMAKARLKICQEVQEGEWEDIEKRFGGVQVEEIIELARDDLLLMRNIIVSLYSRTFIIFNLETELLMTENLPERILTVEI